MAKATTRSRKKSAKKRGARRSARELILGIDIGGTGIKGAPVDIRKGTLAVERHRIPTPRPATPDAVARTVGEIAKYFKWKGPIGCTFPAVVKDGTMHSAANVDKKWIGCKGRALFEAATGCPVEVVNDADAAGIAEMTYGRGKGVPGTVILLTFGTGIGSAVFLDGKLLPNSELGHLEWKGKDAEHVCSDRVRTEKDMSWKKWGKKVNDFLLHLEFLLAPDLYIIGGGVSKKHEKYLRFIDTEARVAPAKMLNDAGIVGAAMAARKLTL